jgi:hypothetical protein
MAETERTLAVFIDFENLAIGFKHRRGEFDIHKILERLVEKGKVIVRRPTPTGASTSSTPSRCMRTPSN